MDRVIVMSTFEVLHIKNMIFISLYLNKIKLRAYVVEILKVNSFPIVMRKVLVTLIIYIVSKLLRLSLV